MRYRVTFWKQDSGKAPRVTRPRGDVFLFDTWGQVRESVRSRFRYLECGPGLSASELEGSEEAADGSIRGVHVCQDRGRGPAAGWLS